MRGRNSVSLWPVTALAALAPMAWGTTYLTTSELLPPERPLFSALLRALPVGLLVLAFTRTLPRGMWWWRALVLGVLNIGAFFTLLFAAAYRLPGGVAATLNAIQPLLVAGLAFGLLGQRPTLWRLGWGVAGVAGVALIVLRGELAFDAVGLLAGLGGAGVMATGLVLAQRWGRPDGVSVLSYTAWQLTAGGLTLLPFALFVEGAPPAMNVAEIGGYAWLALPGTLLAYLAWFYGLGRLPATRMSFLGLLSPAVAAVLGWLVLDQRLTAAQIAGFALALSAIVAAQLSPPQRKNRRTRRDAHFADHRGDRNRIHGAAAPTANS